MLIIPEPKKQQRRIKVAPPQTPPGPAPLVVTEVNDLEYDSDYAAMTVYLDVAEGQELIDPVTADAGKWSTRVNGIRYVGTSVQLSAANALHVTFQDAGIEAGPNVLGYRAEPSDISDTSGAELQAFSDFPV